MTKKKTPEEKEATKKAIAAAKKKNPTPKKCTTKTYGGGSSTWKTGDEITFIKKLGHHCPNRFETTRLELLEGYMNGLEKRVKLGNLDIEKIRFQVLIEIAKEKRAI